MIKKLRSPVLVALATFALVPLLAQTAEKQPQKKLAKQVAGPGKRTSPHETVFARIGDSRSLVSITYGRPYRQKGGKSDGEVRKIWGGLVPWDKADRLGSDEATTIVLQDAISIGGTKIPAGIHALYIVPSENGATKLAFSSNPNKWGIPVDEKHDIARVELKKETLSSPVEQLTITVENAPPEGGVIKIAWETTQLSLPFSVAK